MEKTDLLSKTSRKQFYDDLHDLIISELEGMPYFAHGHIYNISKVILNQFKIAKQEEKEILKNGR